jgi:methylaspartate ammonia-lyase
VTAAPTTKTERIIAALAARAEGGTPLDFVEDWIGSGQSLLALADSLTASMGEPVRRDALSRLVYNLEGARTRLPEARRRGADALVDQAARLLDEAPTDSREALTKTIKQVEFRQWLAERSNPGNWGGQKQNVNVGVHLTIGELHLKAMQEINSLPRVTATVSEPAALPSAADFEVIAE